MNKLEIIQKKIITITDIEKKTAQWRLKSDTIVFTNGCFDLLHAGHINLLYKAADLGSKLIVGLNKDTSVQLLKGPTRPIQNEKDRALILAALAYVDAVVLFEEETPLNLIKVIMPDVLVKGGDYNIATIIGAKEVSDYGGQVHIIPLLPQHSTTQIIKQMK